MTIRPLDAPGSTRLCRRCHLLLPSEQFRVSNRYMAHCLGCRRAIGKMHGGKNADGTWEFYTTPPKPCGLPRLRAEGKHRDRSKQPLFWRLPEHLRPLAMERLEWTLNRYPEVRDNPRQYSQRKAALVANVSSIVLRQWKLPNTNWGMYMKIRKQYKDALLHRMGFKQRAPKPSPEVLAERRQAAEQQREEWERTRFRPSAEAVELAQSVKFVKPKRSSTASQPGQSAEIWSHNA